MLEKLFNFMFDKVVIQKKKKDKKKEFSYDMPEFIKKQSFAFSIKHTAKDVFYKKPHSDLDELFLDVKGLNVTERRLYKDVF